MSRQSEGDRKIAELRDSLGRDLNRDRTQRDRLAADLVVIDARILATADLLRELGPAPAPKRVRKAKADAGGLPV